MKANILVINNCITGPLASCLSFLFPECDVVKSSVLDLDGSTSNIISLANSADYILVHSRFYDKLIDIAKLNVGDGQRIIKVPEIWFRGFHPDIAYATYGSDGAYVIPNYNSAIIAWAYSRKMPKQHIAELFSYRNMIELGYCDAWQASVDFMAEEFKNASLEFEEWYLAVKRTGVFMYTINHPKRPALIKLAKMLAYKISETCPLCEDIYIEDALWREVWPIYPPIGETLGLPSSYLFRYDDSSGVNVIYDLPGFIDYWFCRYQQLNISHDDIAPRINFELYDRVLG